MDTHSEDVQVKIITNDILDFMEGMLKENAERATVILGCARLEYTLEKLLKKLMINNPEGEDNLFDSDHPLSSFSSKISLSYRFGLIDHGFDKALHMIRRIRNDFAHSMENLNLLESRNRNRLNEAVNLAKKDHAWEELKSLRTEIVTNMRKSDEFANLCIVIALMIMRLEVLILCVNSYEIETMPASFELNAE